MERNRCCWPRACWGIASRDEFTYTPTGAELRAGFLELLKPDPQPYVSRLRQFLDELPVGAAGYAVEAGRLELLYLDLARFGRPDWDAPTELVFRDDESDEALTFRYAGVSGIEIRSPAMDAPQVTQLGVVQRNEVRPHIDGCVHEITCLGGSITVTCRDFTAAWGR